MLTQIVLLPFYVFILLAQGAAFVCRALGLVLWELMRDRTLEVPAGVEVDPRRRPGESIAEHVARLRG